MQEYQENGISILRFDNLSGYSTVQHGFCLRKGGTSPPPFDSLNVSFGVGDENLAVLSNRRLISSPFRKQRLIFAHQVHGTKIIVCPNGPGAGKGEKGEAPQVGDAMITDEPLMGLVIQVADCQSVMIYDPEHRAIGNIHCGWRGSVANVIGKTIDKLQEAFGCRPERMIAGVGPSLGPCCAEFINYRQEIPTALWRYKQPNRRFDFWAMTVDQLCNAGLIESNIEISGLCTRCRTDLFFSYRAEKVTGRCAAVIGLTTGLHES